MSYQWQRDGISIPGATSPTLVLTADMTDDTAQWRVKVSNAAGDTVSSHATLTVNPARGLSLVAGALGGEGNTDGADARFSRPSAIAVAPGGQITVVEPYTRALRNISPNGIVSTISVKYPDPEWRFYGWVGIESAVLDPAGYLVGVGANGKHVLRRIGPDGIGVTFAGSDESGSADGVGPGARFFSPSGIAMDRAGNFYVADTRNHTIRKVTPAAVVTTIAGLAGAAGSADGPAALARFDYPTAVAVDEAGVIYVSSGRSVRKITLEGKVSTLAGSHDGPYGSLDGPAQVARFSSVDGLAVDRSGNVYVADGFDCTIRRISAAGMVDTLAGKSEQFGSKDGTGAQARFCSNSSFMGTLAWSTDGNLLLSDKSNQTIRKISLTGDVSTLAGRADAAAPASDGLGAAARFAGATRLATDAAGNIYVSQGSTVRKVSRGGKVTTLALPTADRNNKAYDYFVGTMWADGSMLAVADHVLFKVDVKGQASYIAGIAGGGAAVNGPVLRAVFGNIAGAALDDAGNVYVIDNHESLSGDVVYATSTIRKITPAGEVSAMYAPSYEEINSILAAGNGVLFFSLSNNSVARYSVENGVATVVGSQNGIYPGDLALDKKGDLYILDRSNRLVQKWDTSNTLSTVAGTLGARGVKLGALPGSLNTLDAMTIGPDGVIYVVSENSLLRIVE